MPRTLAGLMFGQDTGDMIVNDNDLVDVAEPLLGENSNGGGAAADAHALSRVCRRQLAPAPDCTMTS